jgi:hypothetical protein
MKWTAMADDEDTPKFPRWRFIMAHLAVLLFVSICFGSIGAYGFVIPLIAIVAPLARIPGAGRADVTTFVLSTVIALVGAACVAGIGILLLASGLSQGRV